MLYLWPYIVFFSLPLLYPYLLNALIPNTLLPSFLDSKTIKLQRPRLLVVIPIIAITVTIVHYNTLIHPFTLADNRHYTFYVFRILLRHPLIKYLAVPIYSLCAWAALTALGGTDHRSVPLSARKREKQPEYQSPDARRALSDPATEGPRASFLLLWLLATAASVVTAPLVEPRYFIVPWLIWRLRVAATLGNGSPSPVNQTTERTQSEIDDDGSRFNSYIHRLWLETAWFSGINIVIGYMFLYRGFEWPQEPGKVQRFMW